MKRLLQAINKHRSLRVKQEVLFHKFIKANNEKIIPNPYDGEFKRYNSAVSKIEKILPGWYFLVSDIFGGASSLKKKSHKELLISTYPDSIN